jgi:hypothetical protein
VQLEFVALSRHTGDPKFGQAAERVFRCATVLPHFNELRAFFWNCLTASHFPRCRVLGHADGRVRGLVPVFVHPDTLELSGKVLLVVLLYSGAC